MGLILHTGSLIHAESRRTSFTLFDDFGNGFSIEFDKEYLPHLVAAVKVLEQNAREGKWWSTKEQERIDAWEAAERLDPNFERPVEQVDAVMHSRAHSDPEAGVGAEYRYPIQEPTTNESGLLWERVVPASPGNRPELSARKKR